MATPQAVNKKALAAAAAMAHLSQQEYLNLCEQFIENAYGTSGVFPTAAAAGATLATHQVNGPAVTQAETQGDRAPGPLSGAEVGDLVFFAPDASNDNAGHVGIYIGNGKMVSATPNGVKTSDILKDPYYSKRLLGWGSPPDEWSGPVSTPALEKGAQTLITAAQSGPGGTPMADDPNAAEAARLERQLADIETMQRYIASRTPAAKWLEAEGLTPQQWTALKVRLGVDPDAKQTDKNGKPTGKNVDVSGSLSKYADAVAEALRKVRIDAGKADVAKPGAPATRQGPGGQEYIWDPSANGGAGSYVPAPGIPAPEPPQRAATKTAEQLAAESTASVAQSNAATAASQASTDRTTQLTPFEVAAARAKAEQEQFAAGRNTFIDGLNEQVGSKALTPTEAKAKLAEYDTLHQSRAEQLQAEQEQRLRDALEETRKQNLAGNVQALLRSQNERQQTANQAQSEYDQYGVGTPERYAQLQAMHQPYGVDQAAAALGKAPDDPAVQQAWSLFQKAQQGSGAQPTPTPAPAPGAAPAPVAPVPEYAAAPLRPLPAAYASLPGGSAPPPALLPASPAAGPLGYPAAYANSA